MRKKLLLAIPLALLILLAGGYFLAGARVQTLVDGRMAGLIASGQYRALDYQSLTLALNGDVVMQDLHVIDESGNEYILEDIRISELDYFSDMPRRLQVSAKGLRFPAGLPAFGDSPAPPLRIYLENRMQAGYLPLELNYRYALQPEDGNRLDSSISISLPDGFHLDSAAVMHHVVFETPPGAGDGQPAVMPSYSALLNDAEIPSASISLRDMGIVQDMLSIQGGDFGMDGDEYRTQLLAQLQTIVLFSPRQLQGLAQDYLGRIADFLQGQRTLRISIEPEFGGNVQQLQGEILGAFYIGNFSRIVEVLNLEVETL